MPEDVPPAGDGESERVRMLYEARAQAELTYYVNCCLRQTCHTVAIYLLNFERL
jgi:hypothetical protein